MSSDAPRRLRDTFGGPEWTWLRDKLRHRFEQEKPLPATMRCPRPSPEQKRAIASVLGKPEAAAVVPLGFLAERLRAAGLCDSLRDMVEILDGPIAPKAEKRRRTEAKWDALAERAANQLRDPRMDPEARRNFHTTAPWKRLSHQELEVAERLLDQVAKFFQHHREWRGRAPTRLAAEVFGDSHALDRDTALYRALALLAGRDPSSPREVWTHYRLIADEVSSHALVLGLRFRDSGAVTRGFNAFAEAGQPVRILMRHLRNPLDPEFPNGRLYVCENPSILEAAADQDHLRHPMLCVEGNPSRACMDLLGAATRAGADILYHGDFDWGGLRIANRVRTHCGEGFTPWRFDVEAYQRLKGGHPCAALPWRPTGIPNSPTPCASAPAVSMRNKSPES